MQRSIAQKANRSVLVVLWLVLCLTYGIKVASAQSETAISSFEGGGETGRVVTYLVRDVAQGDTIDVYASGTSGNFDPSVAIGDEGLTPADVRNDYLANVEKAIAEGRDPLLVIPEVAEEFFLAWDDDSGLGYDAAVSYTAPADDSYLVLLFASPNNASAGAYNLTIGVNAPQVLTGKSLPTTNAAANPVSTEAVLQAGVQEITGTLSAEDPATFLTLADIRAENTVYIYAEGTSGDLKPIFRLEDGGGKPVRNGNLDGSASTATLDYTFPEDGRNYTLYVRAADVASLESGEFRVLIGLNQPEVLTGDAELEAPPVVKEPTPVKIGVKLDQITGVDQKAENFGAVLDVRTEWSDPRLAFSADECQCRFKTYSLSAFISLVTASGAEWPEYTVFNQQGRRDSQSPTVVVFPNGNVIFVDRFTATLQAPDFNFRQFPFDRQQFFIRLRAIFPEEFYTYVDLPTYSAIGDQLGEEEWVLEEWNTSIDTHDTRSRYNFGFSATRHLSYYIFRIFVPVLLIIIVAWITFFLKDYSRRIEVTSGNLLLFIAFNFTISGELPRLGYLTFLDTILVSAFVISALVIVLNVYLKRLEVQGNEERARKIDKFVIWFYPIAYILGSLIVVLIFFTEAGQRLLG